MRNSWWEFRPRKEIFSPPPQIPRKHPAPLTHPPGRPRPFLRFSIKCPHPPPLPAPRTPPPRAKKNKKYPKLLATSILNMFCDSPDHPQGAEARIPQNCCGDLLRKLPGKLGVLAGVLGELLRRLPGRVPFLRPSEQGQTDRARAVPRAVSAKVPQQSPQHPEFPRQFPQQLWGIRASGPCRWSGESQNIPEGQRHTS